MWPFKPKAAGNGDYSDTSGLDSTTARIWVDFFGGSKAQSGATVDANTALFSNAIAACILVRGRSLSSLPVHIYKVNTRTKADDHPAAAMFRTGPNEFMTWAQFMKHRETLLILTGNALYRKTFDRGRVVGFTPLHGACRPLLDDKGRVFYRFDPRAGDVAAEDLPASAVLHYKWDVLTADGLSGRSVVEIAKEAIGLDLDAESFLGRILSNGTHMGVVLTTDNVLAPDQIEELKLQLADGQGVTGAGKSRVFQNGLKPMVLGMNVKEAMLEEQRRYINEKIAAICGVPLSLLNDLTHGTFANYEQQALGYVIHNLVPSVVEFEQVSNKGLFVGADADKFYIKMSVQGILRGDFQTRMAGYEIGIRSGMWSPDECREWEDQDPIAGGTGGIHVMQAQMETLETIANPPAPPPQLIAAPEPEEDEDEDVGVDVPEAIAADAAERIRIRAQIDAEKKRAPEDTAEWARKILAPIAASYAAFDTEAFIAEAIGS